MTGAAAGGLAGTAGAAQPLSVLYSFPHPLGAPGINTTAWQQIAALAEHGAEVTVYCTSLTVPLPPAVRVVETLTAFGRRIPHRVLGVARTLSYHDARVARALRRHPGRWDVVHCWPSSAIRTIAAARATGVRSFRELPNAHTAATFASSKRACAEIGIQLPEDYSHAFDATRLALEEREFGAADFLLAPSEFVRQSFLDHGIEPGRLLRHRYGYDPDRFQPAARATAEHPTGGSAAVTPPARTLTGIFVGRGEPPKGLHIALRAWLGSEAGRQGGQFLIVGSMLAEYGDYLKPMLDEPNVCYLGFTDDVGAALGRADVLVFPTYTEGSALVSYEAMACGVIPLASTAAGAPVQDGVDGLLHEPGAVSALIAQLDMLADRPELRARLRARALATAAGLTWSAAGSELLARYRDGLSAARSSTSQDSSSA